MLMISYSFTYQTTVAVSTITTIHRHFIFSFKQRTSAVAKLHHNKPLYILPYLPPSVYRITVERQLLHWVRDSKHRCSIFDSVRLSELLDHSSGQSAVTMQSNSGYPVSAASVCRMLIAWFNT